MIRVHQISPEDWRDALKNVAAVLVSLLLNGTMLCLIALWSMLQASRRPPAPPAPPEEIVINLEELMPQILPEPPVEIGPKPFAETFADQEADRRPDQPVFESDRNTLAATELLPDEPGEAPVPTQKGLDRIDVMMLREHNYADGPDAEIPRSASAPPGAPVTMAALRPPDAPLSPPLEALPLPRPPEEVKEPPAEVDPTQTQMVAEADRGELEEPPPAEAAEGPEGGLPEPLEMAKLDVPTMRETFTDALDVLDETMVKPDRQDAMPEKAPELSDPTVPFFQMPKVRPSAPLVATPIPQPMAPAVPVNPGAPPRPELNGAADMAAFSPERRLNTMKGSLSNTGKNAVDAESTPVGAYKSAVGRAVERRWHELRLQHASFVSYGSLKVRFLVNRRGHVSGIRIVHQQAGAVLTDFSLSAIATAAIPPMPKEVADAFGNDPLEVTYDILIY